VKSLLFLGLVVYTCGSKILKLKNMESIDQKPLVIVNFKDYDDALGMKAVDMLGAHEAVVSEFPDVAKIVVAVHPTDLKDVCKAAENVSIFSESADYLTRGPDGLPKTTQTGRLTPKILCGMGVRGALVNHAENFRTDDEIKMIVEDFKSYKPDFVLVVCAESTERAVKILSICKPDYIALEPPELIGGDVSVTTKEDVVREAVAKVGNNLLVGAGVKTGEDLKKALEFGAKGVLLASGIVKPKDKTPKQALIDLIK